MEGVTPLRPSEVAVEWPWPAEVPRSSAGLGVLGPQERPEETNTRQEVVWPGWEVGRGALEATIEPAIPPATAIPPSERMEPAHGQGIRLPEQRRSKR
jgi:hypothetical protein